jgi:hypothetical protein
VCVCVCVCAGLRLYAFFLCFLGFLWVVICAVAVSFIATRVLLALRVYVCVRPGRLLSGV